MASGRRERYAKPYPRRVGRPEEAKGMSGSLAYRRQPRFMWNLVASTNAVLKLQLGGRVSRRRRRREQELSQLVVVRLARRERKRRLRRLLRVLWRRIASKIAPWQYRTSRGQHLIHSSVSGIWRPSGAQLP